MSEQNPPATPIAPTAPTAPSPPITSSPSAPMPPTPPRPSLLARIFLDWRFQLSYAGLLAGVALILSGALGSIVWALSLELVDQSERAVHAVDETVRQGRESAERARVAVREQQHGTEVLKIYMAEHYWEDQSLWQRFLEEDAADAKSLEVAQDRLERETAALSARALAVEQQFNEVHARRQQLLITLAAVLGSLVICTGVAGIVLSRRMASPIGRVKRQLAELGAGRFTMREPRERGESFRDLLDAVDRASNALEGRRVSEIEKLDAALSHLREAAAAKSVSKVKEGIERLAEVRKAMDAG